MAGVKGRSGRKPHLEDKTIREICRLSALQIFRVFRDPSVSLETKSELAKHFVLKAMPTVMNSDGSFAPKTVVIIRSEENVASRLEAHSITQ